MGLLVLFVWVFNAGFMTEKRGNQTMPDWFRDADFNYVLGAILGVYFLIGLVQLIRNVKQLVVLGTGSVKLSGPAFTRFIDAENRHARNGSISDFFSGMRILLVQDSEWKDIVSYAIAKLDVIFFDVSEMSEQMRWELQALIDGDALGKTIFLSETGEGLDRVSERLGQNVEALALGCVVYGSGSTGRKPERDLRRRMARHLERLADG